MRTDGCPSGVDVASAMALGLTDSPASASASQSLNSTIGSLVSVTVITANVVSMSY